MFKSLLSICLLLFYANCQFNGIDVSVWQGPNIDFQAVKTVESILLFLELDMVEEPLMIILK